MENVLAVIALLIFCLANANAIVALIPQISNSKDSASQVLRLANLPSKSHEDVGHKQLDLDGFVSLYSVSFAYPSRPDHFVLRNLSLQIQPGECVAIVGSSGCGKSTIASLIQRLYEPTQGVMSYSGCYMQDLSTTYLRSQIAVVSQTSILFPRCIRSNILYGIPQPLQAKYAADVEYVGQAVGIHDWIITLPHGYDTVLNSDANSISGGQAQRIAIARALIRRPKILLLDECTSALDAESSALVADTITRLTTRRSNQVIETGETRDSLEIRAISNGTNDIALGIHHFISGLNGKMTVIIITHKREMMGLADRIVLVDQGMVVEDGTFAELKARKGSKLDRLLNSDGSRS